MELETNFRLKDEFYPVGQPPHSILDFAYFESIEAEYVNFLHELIRSSGCDRIVLSHFTDYRGCYPSDVRANIVGYLPKKSLVSGMKFGVEGELDLVLKMSFRKLISVRLAVCDELAVSTYDIGIGATILAEKGRAPNIAFTGVHFKVDVAD